MCAVFWTYHGVSLKERVGSGDDFTSFETRNISGKFQNHDGKAEQKGASDLSSERGIGSGHLPYPCRVIYQLCLLYVFGCILLKNSVFKLKNLFHPMIFNNLTMLQLHDCVLCKDEHV